MKWLTVSPCGCIDVVDDGQITPVYVFVSEADDTVLLGGEVDDTILAP